MSWVKAIADPSTSNPTKNSSGDNISRRSCKTWLGFVKGFDLRYHNDTILFTIDPYYGNLAKGSGKARMDPSCSPVLGWFLMSGRQGLWTLCGFRVSEFRGLGLQGLGFQGLGVWGFWVSGFRFRDLGFWGFRV